MKKWLIVLLLVMFLPVCVQAAGSTVMYVSAPDSGRVHLRLKAMQQGESLGLYFTGTPVTAESVSGEWVKVRIGAEKGYMRRDCLSDTQPESAAPYQLVDNNSSTWVNLREKPSTSATSLGRFDNGTVVLLLGETKSGWSYVSIPAKGMTGYMVTDMLSDAPAQLEQTPEPQTTFTPISTVQPAPTVQPAVSAQPVEQTGVLGRTSDGDYIHVYAAPNGQYLCFDALLENPSVYAKDVNFDGVDDLVVITAMGTSNVWSELFVYDGTRYSWVEHIGFDDGLSNITLHPEQGIIATYANNGSAGAEHESCLFRWENGELKLIRRAVGEVYAETQYTGDRVIRTEYRNKFQFAVYDHSQGGEGRMVFSEITSAPDYELFAREEAALWQGLK